MPPEAMMVDIVLIIEVLYDRQSIYRRGMSYYLSCETPVDQVPQQLQTIAHDVLDPRIIVGRRAVDGCSQLPRGCIASLQHADQLTQDSCLLDQGVLDTTAIIILIIIIGDKAQSRCDNLDTQEDKIYTKFALQQSVLLVNFITGCCCDWNAALRRECHHRCRLHEYGRL